MQIEILSVTINNKGKYNEAEVAFKNLQSGKVEGKKIVSFVNPDVWKTIADAKPGNSFNVTTEKDAKNYWQWTAITAQAPGQQTQTETGTPKMAYATPVKNTYETPEERAAKQTSIVRQSSLSNAINVLTATSKSAVKVEDILSLAETFESWVIRTDTSVESLAKMANDIEVD